MSDEKMVTEREAVQREREAFAKGARQAHDDQYRARMHQKDSGMYRYDFREGMRSAHDDAWRVVMRADAAEQAARLLYPLPNVTRTRVVSEDTPYGLTYWRFVEGELQWARSEGKWHTLTEDENGRMFIRAARVRLLAHLMDNPTEEVDADADA